MSRPRRYETNAAKQRAYRIRKRENLKFNPEYEKATHEVEIYGPDLKHPRLPFETKKVGELRMIVLPEEEKPRTEAPVSSGRPVVYRNDYGGVISKMAWEKLQKLKEDAKSGGYELDDYSQGVK